MKLARESQAHFVLDKQLYFSMGQTINNVEYELYIVYIL